MSAMKQVYDELNRVRDFLRRRIAEYYSSKYASIDFANHIALPKF